MRLFALACLAFFVLSAQAKEVESPTRPPDCDRRRVQRVVDGDSIVVQSTSGSERVRLIGVDCPPRFSKEPFEKKVSTKAAFVVTLLAEGRHVWLEYDEQRQDKYGRTLAYVWLDKRGDAVLLNADLVRRGLAKVGRHPTNLKHHEYLLQVQREARQARAGLWGELVPEDAALPAEAEAEGVTEPASEAEQDGGEGGESEEIPEKLKTYPMRRFLRVGGLGYCVHKAEWRDELTDNQFLDDTPDAAWLVVDVTVRNVDKENRHVPVFKLLDSKGREYVRSSKSSYLKDCFSALKNLNPGVSSRGSVAFDVPKGRRYCLVSSAGWLKDEFKLIYLRPTRGLAPVAVPESTTRTPKREPPTFELPDFTKDPVLIGDWTTKKYHRPTCRKVRQIKAVDRAEFDSVEEARGWGFQPCKHCQAPRR